MISRLTVQELALDRGERRLFEGLSIRLVAGEVMSLTGSNGAGKTSLLRCVAGLLSPAAGRVGFAGDTGDIDADEARSTGLHLVGHQDGLRSSRTAGQELAFWSRWAGADDQGVRMATRALELGPLLALQVRRLSAGQRRRLALARLIAAPRALWLLDEPLAPLDEHHRTRFGALMSEHLAQGGMILAAVHDPLPILARALRVGTSA